jgi:hypothetical protein
VSSWTQDCQNLSSQKASPSGPFPCVSAVCWAGSGPFSCSGHRLVSGFAPGVWSQPAGMQKFIANPMEVAAFFSHHSGIAVRGCCWHLQVNRDCESLELQDHRGLRGKGCVPNLSTKALSRGALAVQLQRAQLPELNAGVGTATLLPTPV